MSDERTDIKRFPVGALVEMVVDEPEEDRHRGERGFVMLHDYNGDLHIHWYKQGAEVWGVAEAIAKVRVVTDPEDMFPVGVVVELLATRPVEDERRGVRGTVVSHDASGHVHVALETGQSRTWPLHEAVRALRVIEEPETRPS
jgi:hypothetical protein